MRNVLVASCLVAAGSMPAPASAQTSAWGNNGYLGFNAIYQGSSSTFVGTTTLEINHEEATLRATHAIDAGPVFELSGGGRVYRNLGFGFAGSYFDRRDSAHVDASVPHPFFFEQPRAISGEANDLRRQELAVHLDAMYLLPLSPRVQLSVFGGPSFFRLKQALVTGVHYSESYPYDEAQFTGIDATEVRSSWSHVGYNIGADLTVFFSRYLGLGVSVRRSEGDVEFDRPNGPLEVEAGGTQAGVGLRVRF